MEPIHIYTDEECKVPLTKLTFERQFTGTTRKQTLYIENRGEYPMGDIKAIVTDPDLSVRVPKTIAPGKIAEVYVTWKPKLSRETVLKTEVGFTANYMVG